MVFVTVDVFGPVFAVFIGSVSNSVSGLSPQTS